MRQRNLYVLAIGLSAAFAIVGFTVSDDTSAPRHSEDGAESSARNLQQLNRKADEDQTSASGNERPGEQLDPSTATSSDPGLRSHRLAKSDHVTDLGPEIQIDPPPGEPIGNVRIELTKEDAARLLRDCPGRGRKSCRPLAEFAASIVATPDDESDGWSEWMGQQILEDLRSVASANRLNAIGAKCSIAGCVFYVGAASSNTPPDGSTGRWLYNFEHWLNHRPWRSELADRGGIEQPQFFSKNRIIESTAYPYIIWYVVQRRP